MNLFKIPLRISLILTLILTLFISCNQKKDVPTEGVNSYDELFSSMYQRGQFNGNVMVIKKGEIVYQGSFGLKNIDPIDSLELGDRFRLASVSKQFTAAAIVQLKEKGKLSYDQNIKDFIPGLPYEGITIRHLLNHVSGLPDYEALLDENWKPELKYNDLERFVSGNEDIINMMIEMKPGIDFEPEEKWEYSNTGYLFLATIVSKASGMPFETYVKENIFAPAGMGSVVYDFVPGPDPNMPERVFGYRTELDGERVFEDMHYVNPVQGDGGIYASLEDLRKWDRALYTDKIISEASRKEVFSPFVLKNGDTTDYGFGWFLDKSPSGKKVVLHSGGWVGFRTFIYREIEEDNCFILLSNNSDSYLGEAVQGLKNILHDKPFDIPKITIVDTLRNVIVNNSLNEGLVLYRDLKETSSEDYNFNEGQLNNLGYQLMSLEKHEEAIGILEHNNSLFPESANTFDSMGDAYLASGDTLKALINFKNAVKLDSSLTYSRDKIKKLESK
ncbi:serine hydrolase [Lutimonas halocynthiae]|uniref:serine hydrolase n=1 Tax=Lutimonas halocynthiae TaxID=1446477 RepID=UPI0025B33154|nr:serine hydrolase [Lutimonas halocynthiae]MDN3641923.1 serine hydrolase [Lutimonas halocynthiae]